MKKNNRKISKWNVLYWILAFVPFIVSICFYNRLPEQVPTHWGSDNVVNGYSSRNMAAFGIPAFMFLMAVMVNVIYRIDPKRENISRSRELKQITRWFVVLLAVMVQFVIVLSGIGVDINVGSMVSLPNADRTTPWESSFRGPWQMRITGTGLTAWPAMYGRQGEY